MEAISDSRLKINLYKRILLSYQRAGLELADLYFFQFEYAKALKFCQMIAETGQLEIPETFYKILLECLPSLKVVFDEIQEIDLKDRKKVFTSLPLARWLALLSLIEPDMKKVIQLFQHQMALITFWQSDSAMFKKIS